MNDATCAECSEYRPGNLAESDPGCIMQCRCIILASASKCMQITLLYSIITLLFSLAPSLSYFDNPS